jgi:5'-3' exoribonuclease 1
MSRRWKRVNNNRGWVRDFSSSFSFIPNKNNLSSLSLVLTNNQKRIFDKIKAFVLDNRKILSPSHYRAARLALPNDFPARDRVFITKLSGDLHLQVGWDEYDDQDQNLVTWRFPRVSNGVVDKRDEVVREEEEEEVIVEQEGSGSNSEWEDEPTDEDDDEAYAAVDRVLKKYEKAAVVDLDSQGSFDERYERSVKEKMDEWKRGYYQVFISSSFFFSF